MFIGALLSPLRQGTPVVDAILVISIIVALVNVVAIVAGTRLGTAFAQLSQFPQEIIDLRIVGLSQHRKTIPQIPQPLCLGFQ